MSTDIERDEVVENYNVEQAEELTEEEREDNYLTAKSSVNTNYEPEPGTPEWNRLHPYESGILKSSDNFDDVLEADMEGNEEIDTTNFNERIKKDFSFQITCDRKLSQAAADIIGVDFKDPCKGDQYMTRAPYGRQQYFGCFVPEGYFITQSGIWRMDQKSTKEEIVETPVCICTTRVMPTGHFISNEGIDITELTFAGYKSHLEVLRVPTAALQSKQNYNKIVRNNNYGSLDILDDELNGTLTFLKAARKLNLEEGGTTFKTGEAYSRCGWTDKTCTKLIAGNSLIHDVNGNIAFEECIFIDDKLAHTFDPVGTIEGYFEAIKPLMHLDVVRFIMYSTLASPLLYYYNTDSFTIDLYGGIPGSDNDKSSSGKSTLIMIGIGGLGCIVDNNKCIALIHQYQSSEPFIENLSNKICDFTMGVDETTAAADVQAAEKRIYKATSGKTRGKASDGHGGIQITSRKTNILMFTGENSLLPDTANIGAKVRVVSIRGGMGISNIGKLVSDAKVGCMNNYGHLLRPYITEFFKQRHDNNLDGYFNEMTEKFRESTADNLAQRRSRYFSVIATAGKLLEPIFAKYGIEEKDPYKVVKNMWNKHVLSNLIEAQWKQTLREALNLYFTNKEANFDIPKISGKLMFGWTKKVYNQDGTHKTQIYYNKATLDEHLLKKKFNPDIAYDSLREIGLTICNKPKYKKDDKGNVIGEYKPYSYLTANKNGDQIQTISFMLEDAYELLEYGELEKSETFIQLKPNETEYIDNVLKQLELR